MKLFFGTCDVVLYPWQDVGQILVGSDGAAKGVVLKDGTEIHSKAVLSNATPYVTFKNLTPQVLLRIIISSQQRTQCVCFFNMWKKNLLIFKILIISFYTTTHIARETTNNHTDQMWEHKDLKVSE